MAIVRFERSQIPPMSEERKAELRALAERPDSEIDFSDIPELTEDFWENAKPLAELHAMDRMEELYQMRILIERQMVIIEDLSRKEKSYHQDESHLRNLLGRELVSWLLKHGKQCQTQLKEVLQKFALQHS